MTAHATDDGRRPRAVRFFAEHRDWLWGRSVLDVGCDRRHLAEPLEASGGTLWGIGLGGTPDQEVDLEAGTLPFADGSFDVVVCLDVLEHIEAAHAVFDELCRVARRTVIVVLPSPWADFYAVLRTGAYRQSAPFKYYGLPVDRPGDSHRWFFGTDDALRFVQDRGSALGFTPVRVSSEGSRAQRRHPLRTAAEWVLFRRSGLVEGLYRGRSTVVLERLEVPQSDRARSA